MPLRVHIVEGRPILHFPFPLTDAEQMVVDDPERIQLRNAALSWNGVNCSMEERDTACKMLIDWYMDHDVRIRGL